MCLVVSPGASGDGGMILPNAPCGESHDCITKALQSINEARKGEGTYQGDGTLFDEEHGKGMNFGFARLAQIYSSF